MIELHKSNGIFHVEIFYKKNRGEDAEPLEPLTIPNCGKQCPIEKFFEIYEDIIPTDDFETECRSLEFAEYTNEGKEFSFVESCGNESFILL